MTRPPLLLLLTTLLTPPCIFSSSSSSSSSSSFSSFSSPFSVVGYLPEWRYSSANYLDLCSIYSHLILFSAEPTPAGSITGLDRLPSSSLFKTIQESCSSTKLLLCYGGNGRSNGFSKMTAKKESRTRFVRETIELITRLGADGVDLNWEYPGIFLLLISTCSFFLYSLLVRFFSSHLFASICSLRFFFLLPFSFFICFLLFLLHLLFSSQLLSVLLVSTSSSCASLLPFSSLFFSFLTLLSSPLLSSSLLFSFLTLLFSISSILFSPLFFSSLFLLFYSLSLLFSSLLFTACSKPTLTEYPGYDFRTGYLSDRQVTSDYEGLRDLIAELTSHPQWTDHVLTLAYYPDRKQEALLATILHPVLNNIDLFHMMAYDQSGRHSTKPFAEKVVAQGVASLLPTEKITLGLPFYARDVKTGDWETYESVLQRRVDLEQGVDEVEGVYFNGVSTIRMKVELAMSEGLGGVMVWEAGAEIVEVA